MRRLAAVLLFIVIEVVLLPVTLLGAVWHWAKLMLTRRRLASSSTAYEVLLVRWTLHATGAREDNACKRLLFALLAARLSGYRPPRLDYPPARPTMAVQIIPQRTDFFDRTLRDHAGAIRQLVILGAGWDTRAYNLPEGAGVPVFEVDTPEMVALKRAALRDAGIDTAHVAFVGVDFNDEPWLEGLERHGFDPALPGFFLWEGVVYYLDDEAVHATLAAIGEPLRFGISTRPPAREQVADLLAAHGLELERYEAWGDDSGDRLPLGGMVAAVS